MAPLDLWPAESQTDRPALWLHPLHASCTGLVPIRTGVSSAQPTEIQELVGLAVTADSKFSAAFGFRYWRWRNQHRISFGGQGLIINMAQDGGPDKSWSIPLRFSEVAHFQTKAGTLFLLIGLRKISEQPLFEDRNGSFKEYWMVGVSGSDEASPQPKAVLLQLLTAMGTLGAIRSDLHDTYLVAHDAVGSGGCASVHLGRPRDPAASKGKEPAKNDKGLVAVKILTADFSYQAEAEAGFLMGSPRHWNLIGFYGLFSFPDPVSHVSRWAIMMEYCSGGDLHHLITANGPCSELRSAEVMFGLFSGLSHLHLQGIVHRDVKSENILLTDQGRPVLADFGIAAYLSDEKAMTTRCGSPGHCAPEILESRKYNAKVDVFSSGVVLYFLVSGTLPFQGPDIGSVLRRNARCNVKMGGESFQLVSSKVKSLIKVFLSKHQEERPESSVALQQVKLAYHTHLRVSPSLIAYATDAAEAADEQITFQPQTSNAAPQLDTEVCLGRPSYMHVSEASSRNRNDGASPERGTYSSRKSTYSSPDTSYEKASDDPSNASESPRLSYCTDLVMADDSLAPGGMQDQVTSKRCQRSSYLGGATSEWPECDEGAGLSTGVEQSGRPLSSQSQDVAKKPNVKNFRRRFPMVTVGSDGNRPRAENASPDNAAELDRQTNGDNSTFSCCWVPRAPLPDDAKLSNRHLIRWRQTIGKHKQATPSGCGSQVTIEEVRAASASEQRSSESWSYTASSCWSTCKSPTSCFHDDCARPCSDKDTAIHKMLLDSPLKELPTVDGVCKHVKVQKPSLPSGMRGWWQRHVPGKTRARCHFRPINRLDCEPLTWHD